MQEILITVLPTVVVILFSSSLTVFLFKTWYSQEVRLLTDLPLVFSLMFTGLSAVMFLQLLFRSGIIEETFELFKVRALVVGLITLPMLVVLLNIWLQRYSVHHSKIVIAFIIYWFTVSLLGPSPETIIFAVMPLMLLLGIALVSTFVVTWKTRRLQEVRSDLMVVGLIIMLISQILRVPFDAMGASIIVDVFLAVGMVLITLGLVNPWKPVYESTPTASSSPTVVRQS